MSYTEYFLDYLDEAYNEAANEIKNGVKQTYYFKKHLQSNIFDPIIAKRSTVEKIIDFTGVFLDKHAYQLHTPGPTHSFVFGVKEAAPLYELFHIDAPTILEHFNEMTKLAYDENKSKSTFNSIKAGQLKLLIAFINVGAINNKNEELEECCKYLMGFAEYPLAFHHSWRIGVNEQVMNYTIEHLPNKFKIKKMNNVLELIKHDMDSVFSLCHDRLATGVDFQYVEFIYRVKNHLKATFVKLANVYFDNIEKNNTQHLQQLTLEDDELANNDGIGANISQTIDNTYNKFLTNPINPALIKICAEGNKCNVDILTTYINQILNYKDNKVYNFIENMITSYIHRNPANPSIGSGEFITYGLSVYRSIAASKNPVYQELRAIVDLWIFEIIKITDFYQNKGTIINYTRGVYNYMIMMIQNLN